MPMVDVIPLCWFKNDGGVLLACGCGCQCHGQPGCEKEASASSLKMGDMQSVSTWQSRQEHAFWGEKYMFFFVGEEKSKDV